jgi:hypothetical protein
MRYFFLPLPFFLLGCVGLYGLLLAAAPEDPGTPAAPLPLPLKLLLLLLLPAAVCGAEVGSIGHPGSSNKTTCMPIATVVATSLTEHNCN